MTSSQPPKKNPAEEQATPSNGAQNAKAKKANASQAQASQNATPQAQVNNAASLRKALNQCMMRDRFRLSKRISGASKIKKDAARNAVFDEIALDIAKSMMVVEQRSSYKPTIEYPEILPVSQKRDDIAKAIEENQVVIVAGETGS
ncbi:ATP-dependent RNA helicase HrpA, partial [Vibrio sp. D173a]|nr:ATP-dependent RNA helicase HrpA [Vibrio sp. D173a]